MTLVQHLNNHFDVITMLDQHYTNLSQTLANVIPTFCQSSPIYQYLTNFHSQNMFFNIYPTINQRLPTFDQPVSHLFYPHPLPNQYLMSYQHSTNHQPTLPTFTQPIFYKYLPNHERYANISLLYFTELSGQCWLNVSTWQL